MLEPLATLVVEPDVAVAEPMGAAAGIRAEPVEPREVVLGIVASMAADADDCHFLRAESKGPGGVAALVLEVDPNLAAGVAAHEVVPRMVEPVVETVVALEVGPTMAEHVPVVVLAPEADPRMAEFEGSM